MTRVPQIERPLEGPAAAARLSRLNPRLRLAGGWERRNRLARAGRALLTAYWIGCLAVIGLGLDRLYPGWRAGAQALVTPSVEANPSAGMSLQGWSTPLPGRWARVGPFPNCAAAHAAGIYNIPAGSPAYRPQQDGDGDGFACEPPPLGRRGF
ncbi:excalibur calcium-binding domain-containing protein [Phenylobacterium sp.]|uniref:excalibur calcium-binding domain-containing protein n=1 Tax=Phenylobacterium sp. TaxID=1871053 RepID=UPI00301C68D0